MWPRPSRPTDRPRDRPSAPAIPSSSHARAPPATDLPEWHRTGRRPKGRPARRHTRPRTQAHATNRQPRPFQPPSPLQRPAVTRPNATAPSGSQLADPPGFSTAPQDRHIRPTVSPDRPDRFPHSSAGRQNAPPARTVRRLFRRPARRQKRPRTQANTTNRQPRPTRPPSAKERPAAMRQTGTTPSDTQLADLLGVTLAPEHSPMRPIVSPDRPDHLPPSRARRRLAPTGPHRPTLSWPTCPASHRPPNTVPCDQSSAPTVPTTFRPAAPGSNAPHRHRTVRRQGGRPNRRHNCHPTTGPRDPRSAPRSPPDRATPAPTPRRPETRYPR